MIQIGHDNAQRFAHPFGTRNLALQSLVQGSSIC
jgi:hypothetical protein